MRVKKLHEHGLSKDTRVTIIFILEKNIIFLANVEFKPGGQSAALQLVLRPLGLFVIEKKHYKNQINAKNYKKCMIFLSISIKNYPKREKGRKNSTRQNFHKEKFQIWPAIKKVWPPLV